MSDTHYDSEFVGGLAMRIARLEQQLVEWQQSFDLYDDAIRRGTALWREATGRRDVLPDTAKLVAWLLGERDRTEQQLAEEREALRSIQCDSLVAYDAGQSTKAFNVLYKGVSAWLAANPEGTDES